MANQGSIANLKQNVNNNIYTNTSKLISGDLLNTVIQNVIDTLGLGVKDFINVNEANSQGSEYSDAQTARGQVPTDAKKIGLVITYLLSDGWHIDQFIGSNISGWGTASNWKGLVVSISQSAETGQEYLYIGDNRVANLTLQTGYYVCSTKGIEQAKVIYEYSYQPTRGGSIKVLMRYANNVDNPTLTVGGVTKPLLYNGVAASSSNSWKDNEIIEIYYDDTYNSNTGAFFAKKYIQDVDTDNTLVDFLLTDEQKNVLLALFGGHIRTKNFNSKEVISALSELQLKIQTFANGDFAIADESGNILLQLINGNIRTKKFSSKDVLNLATVYNVPVNTKNNIVEGGKTLDIKGQFFGNPGNKYGVVEGDLYFDIQWNRFHRRGAGGSDTQLDLSESEKFKNIRDLYFPELLLRQFIGNVRPVHGLESCDFHIKDNMLTEAIISQYLDGHPHPNPAVIYEQYDELVTDYPNFVEKLDIVQQLGMTYPDYANLNGQASGNYEATPTYKTYMYHFKDSVEPYTSIDGKNRKYKVLLFSGVHGGERSAVANLQLFMRNLCKNETKDKNLFFLRQNFEFYVVPCINGYGLYHYQRTNANGVNIERNFNTENWVLTPQTIDGNPNPDYSGAVADSEFETQLIEAIVNYINPHIAIDHHDYGTGLQAQFFNVAANLHQQRIAYKVLQDVSYALVSNYPEFFGNKFRMFVNSVYPLYIDVPVGSFPDWMHFTYRKALMYAICEISEYINFTVDENGDAVLSEGTNWNDAKVFAIAEYTLRTYLERMCEYFDKYGWLI